MKVSASKRRHAIAAGAAVVALATAALAVTVPAMAARSSAAASPVLGAGQVGSRAAVPWAKVGPGWTLASYSASQGGEGVKLKKGPVTLYLVDPAGGRYSLVTWAASSPRINWDLQAWSGNVKRALFVSEPTYGSATRQHVYQLTLRTGKVTSFTLPSHVSALGYTRPYGLNILVEKGFESSLTSKVSLQRYNLTGHLQKTLASVTDLDGAAYQSAGGVVAAGARRGIDLISNGGGLLKDLRVPGASAGCTAVRWWSGNAILASCFARNAPGPRLWLVPASGATPTALTPTRHNGFDLGDFNAWKLSNGLYVDGYGPCATLVIGRQYASGREKEVSVPGSQGSVLIVNATRSKLLVERINGCQAHNSLVWFNPATRALTVAVPVKAKQAGVITAIPYFVSGKY